ncbi:hypothetical protein [Streptomyces sp. PA5.6]
MFKPWFDGANARVEAEEFGWFDAVYDLTFLLPIDQQRAWFRWDDGPAMS